MNPTPTEPALTIPQAVQIALEHHLAGRLQQAEAIYRQILRAEPSNFDALHSLGAIAFQVGRYDVAIEYVDLALAVQPDHAEALRNRGVALQNLDRPVEALASFERALASKPDYAEAFNSRGNALRKLNRPAEALASFERALAIKPDFAEALNNRGNVLQELKRPEEALASYDLALAIKPEHAETWSNRGLALQELNRPEEALASCNQALTIRPDYAEALSNRGLVLQELKRPEEALTSYDQALAINPDYAEAWSNRGLALQDLKRQEEALASYERALAIKPDYADAHLNESLCLLLNGDYERGWQKYEWRWKFKGFPSPRRDFSQPLWLGRENLAGATILLHAEQGLGDTIQFCRYADLVARKGARVLLEVQPELRSLLASVAGPSQVLSQGEVLPHFDFHCPLLSLPLAFETRRGSIPAEASYLTPSPASIDKWQKKLGKIRNAKVGLVWSGSPGHRNDRNRSIALSGLARLAVPGITLVSLQNQVRPSDQSALASSAHIRHFGTELADFSDTAALVSLMDLVISVDTSVAHLAGALGKPVWILLPFRPDWRWLLDCKESPWYPSARLFRQPRIGDWRSVIDEIDRGIHKFASTGYLH